VKCQGAGVDPTFALAVKNREMEMAVLETEPHITKAIICRTQQWRKFGDRALPCFKEHDQGSTQQHECSA
jgi:hypothetical protein